MTAATATAAAETAASVKVTPVKMTMKTALSCSSLCWRPRGSEVVEVTKQIAIKSCFGVPRGTNLADRKTLLGSGYLQVVGPPVTYSLSTLMSEYMTSFETKRATLAILAKGRDCELFLDTSTPVSTTGGPLSS